MASTTIAPTKQKNWTLEFLKFFVVVLALFSLYRLTIDATKTGISRLLSGMAIIQSSVEPANMAVKWAPGDPEAHYTRALSLVNLGQLDEAVTELEQATTLRPHYYYEWLDLGVTLDRVGKQPAALAALRESVRLAPFYAQPRWQLGNLLFREGQYDEGFAELRLAVKSNPALFEGILDLAWAASGGDVGVFENLVQAQTSRGHLEMARFLATRGEGSSAARHVGYAGVPSGEPERAILGATISQLLRSGNFSDAYDAWAATHSMSSGQGSKGQVLNGDFLDPVSQNDPGFGWQLAPLANVTPSIDPSGPVSNSRSLRFEFSGDSSPSSVLVSQVILIQASGRYALSFMTRTQELVTGGPPVIRIFDLSSNPTKILGQSNAIPIGSNEWSAGEVVFSTEEKTGAVAIMLERLDCTQNPCPIFGKLWLSRFSLSKR